MESNAPKIMSEDKPHTASELCTATLTVIIPVWNGAEYVKKCLDAIQRQTYPVSNIQLIVVDNGSTDETAEIVKRYPFAELIHEPTPGSYRARNLGLSRANGKFVLFTDSDCIPYPDWIQNALLLTNTMQSTEVVGGQITLFREPGAGKTVSAFEELTSFNQSINIQHHFSVTANWLCHTETIRAVGGFDSELLSGGDIELSRRLSATGCTFRYAPELLVQHPTRATLIKMIKKRRRVIGGKWQMARKTSGKTFPQMRQNLLESVAQARWMIRSAAPLTTKIGLMTIIVILTATSQIELIRLASGFAPYRD